MYKNKKLLMLVAGAACALAIVVGTAVFASTRIVHAQSNDFRTGREAESYDTLLGEDGLERPNRPGPGFPGGDRKTGNGVKNTYLADALGITVEELQAAYTAAWQNGIDQALEQGLLTEAQAEWLKERSFGMHGRGSFLGEWLGEKNAFDMKALLADELGISVEELHAARTEAAEAALQAAIDSGDITQEQADLMRARQALIGTIDRGALEAQALGMTVEELQAAREEGKFIPDLIEEQGLTQDEFQDAVQAAYEQLINQAVADGVITQAQADLLLSTEALPGHGMPPFGPGGEPGGRHL
ncbi:MAG: hypothetical protein A2Z16_02415 [Chloroflexi bacterium RBG_16_54_18]|nr:MAG: hypothetical protein A2Z16_02415 [Chloroflexi bacterium RBG_16_54_18]